MRRTTSTHGATRQSNQQRSSTATGRRLHRGTAPAAGPPRLGRSAGQQHEPAHREHSTVSYVVESTTRRTPDWAERGAARSRNKLLPSPPPAPLHRQTRVESEAAISRVGRPLRQSPRRFRFGLSPPPNVTAETCTGRRIEGARAGTALYRLRGQPARTLTLPRNDQHRPDAGLGRGDGASCYCLPPHVPVTFIKSGAGRVGGTPRETASRGVVGFRRSTCG